MVTNNLLQISYTLPTIQQAVHQFWQYAYPYRVIVWQGQMGAGKTTFCSALAAYLGVAEPLSSPTFALMNEYLLPQNAQKHLTTQQPTMLMHMDWYRLSNAEEAIAAGVENIIQDMRYRCWIEWPQQATALLTMPHLRVEILMGATADERTLSADRVEE